MTTQRRKSSSNPIIAISLALICLLSPLAWSAASQDPLFNMLPEDTLFCVRVNNFMFSLGQMDQYMAGASPVPVGLSMIVNMQLAGILGDPMLTGIDRNGHFAVIGIEIPDQMEPAIVFLVPVTDFKQLTSSNQYCKAAEDGDYFTIAPPNSMLGSLLVTSSPDSQYALAAPGNALESLLAVKGILKKKPAALSHRLTEFDMKAGISTPAWAWMNIDRAYQMSAPMIQMGILRGIKEMQAQQPATAGQPVPSAEELSKSVLEALKQMDSLSIALTPKSDILRLQTSFQAKAGSQIANAMVRDPGMKTGFKMGKYLDPQSPINGLMNMNKPMWIKFNNAFVELFMAALGTEGDMADFVSKFQPLMNKSVEAMGSELAFSFGYKGGTPPFMMQEVIEIKDENAMHQWMKESTGIVNEMYKKMGLSAEMIFKETQEEYKGAKINEASIKFSLPEDAAPEEKAAIDTLYGKEGLTYPFAISKDALYVTMGPDANEKLKKLIDLKDAPSALPSDMQTAMQHIPNADSADTIISINIIRLIKGFSEMMETMAQTAGPQAAGMPPFAKMLEGIPMNTQSAMAMGMHIDKGRIQTQLALPKQHLMEIMAVVMQIQMKTQQMQQAPNPAAAPVN